jgi:hypothetical protein
MASKKETIAEFLARGGVIKRIEAQKPEDVNTLLKSTVAKTPQLYDLGDAAFYFPEEKKPRKRKKKELDLSGINMALIPAHLRETLKL